MGNISKLKISNSQIYKMSLFIVIIVGFNCNMFSKQINKPIKKQSIIIQDFHPFKFRFRQAFIASGLPYEFFRNGITYSIKKVRFIFLKANKETIELYLKVLKYKNDMLKLKKYGFLTVKSINTFMRKSVENHKKILNAIKTYEREKIESRKKSEQKRSKEVKQEMKNVGKSFLGININVMGAFLSNTPFAIYEFGLSYIKFNSAQYKKFNFGLIMEINFSLIDCADKDYFKKFTQYYLVLKPQFLITIWGFGPSYRMFMTAGPILKFRLNTYEEYHEKDGTGIFNNFKTLILGATFKLGYMGVSERGYIFAFFFTTNISQSHFKINNEENNIFAFGVYINFLIKIY